MDRPISIDEAGERFSEIIGDVSAGETFVVTDHGEPVAKISPVPRESTPEELRLQAERIRETTAWLKTQPIIITGPWTRDELYER